MRLSGQVWSACAIAALLGSPVVEAREATASSRSGPDISRIRIDNFGQISATYYRGEQPVGRDYADLAAIGIQTVIDLQADRENVAEPQLVERAGMKFYRIPMTTHAPPTAAQLAEFRQIVNDPTQQPVYVHCKGGKHRTGVMTAVYRMEQDGWSSDRAFKEMKEYKFGMDFLHPELKRFVYDFGYASIRRN